MLISWNNKRLGSTLDYDRQQIAKYGSFHSLDSLSKIKAMKRQTERQRERADREKGETNCQI